MDYIRPVVSGGLELGIELLIPESREGEWAKRVQSQQNPFRFRYNRRNLDGCEA
jgi:hypothetical protein